MQEYERAKSALLESHALAQEMSDRWLQAWILIERGLLSFLEDDPAQADQYWTEGLLLAEPVGERFLLGALLANLGESALYRQEFIPARALLKRGLLLNLELGQKGLTAHFLEVSAALIGATGQPHLAVRLLAAAEALRETMHYTLESHDQRYHHLRVMMARAGLGEGEFAAAWAEGQALSLEQAIEYALDAPREG
jgi:serine/threonine-protein kinase PknK